MRCNGPWWHSYTRTPSIRNGAYSGVTGAPLAEALSCQRIFLPFIKSGTSDTAEKQTYTLVTHKYMYNTHSEERRKKNKMKWTHDNMATKCIQYQDLKYELQ